MGSQSKVRDAALRAFLQSDSRALRRVLVEVDAPETEIAGGGKSARVVVGPGVLRAQEKAVEATRSLFKSLGVEARFLPSARAFLADLTPEQLRAVVEAPSVRNVISNESFQVLR